MPALRRKLELARLIAARAMAEGERSAEAAAFDLADSLAELLDEMQGEGRPLDAFAAVDAGEHAAHWQRSLRFLTLIADYAAAAGPAGTQARMRAAAEALAARWAVAPPARPVIVAGSTGSRAPTRAFMAAVARLPQGALVLPGLDPGCRRRSGTGWPRAEPGAADHPQHGFRRLAAALGFDPGAVPAWHPAAPPNPARNALVSLALRPAPVTDQWRAEGGALRPSLAAAAEGLTWIEAPDEKREALAIALLMREAAEHGTRAALVTPDRTLARRVAAELDRWGLIPDDSAGRPLALTPPGILLRLVAALPGAALTPEALLALLKHPLVASGARAAPAAGRALRAEGAARAGRRGCAGTSSAASPRRSATAPPLAGLAQCRARAAGGRGARAAGRACGTPPRRRRGAWRPVRAAAPTGCGRRVPGPRRWR